MIKAFCAALAGAALSLSAVSASAAVVTIPFAIDGTWFGPGTPYGYAGGSILNGSLDIDDTKTDSTAFVGIDLTVGSRTFTVADIAAAGSYVAYLSGKVSDFTVIFNEEHNYVYLNLTASFGDDTGFLACNHCVTADLGGGVPEPATWALMLLGFGAAGSALRYRRAVAA